MPTAPHLRPLYRTHRWFLARGKAKARARDRCERCGRLNASVHLVDRPLLGELREGVRVLVIQCGAAHLNHVAGDDRPRNLGWFCRGCHNRFDQAHRKESRCTRKDRARPLLTL